MLTDCSKKKKKKKKIKRTRSERRKGEWRRNNRSGLPAGLKEN